MGEWGRKRVRGLGFVRWWVNEPIALIYWRQTIQGEEYVNFQALFESEASLLLPDIDFFQQKLIAQLDLGEMNHRMI